MSCPSVLKYSNGKLEVLDQSQLPLKVSYITCTELDQIVDAIASMKVRGAPAIGSAAAYAMAIVARGCQQHSVPDFLGVMEATKITLDSARPTAVNLMYATARVVSVVQAIAERFPSCSGALVSSCVEQEAEAIAQDDLESNKRLGQLGADLVMKHVQAKRATPGQVRLVHHCNTGHLATTGHGTALGVIYSLQAMKEEVHVFVDETRPRLQGSKLTCWELKACGVPHELVVDGCSGLLMWRDLVDGVVYGADRCAANGDVANKLGTCNLNVVAHSFNVPTFACVPTSTIDITIPTGKEIEIEERNAEEVREIQDATGAKVLICPHDTKVFNPAFDVTPNRFISAIVTEEGIVTAPFEEGLKRMKQRAVERETRNRLDRLEKLAEELGKSNS